MLVVEVEQDSQEWLRMRLGKITGTRLKEVFKSDNLPLIDEMISEIVSEEIEETYINKEMQRGKELEPIVRDLYSEITNTEIKEVGFCISEDNDYLALSPDGFTNDFKGAIEIKCPNTKTHVKYIRQNQIPNEYKYQIYCYFLVNTDLEWLDFISFDNRFKAKPMFKIRVTRNEILDELNKTNDELNKFITKFEKYYKQVLN